jgi:hypothetical protein
MSTRSTTHFCHGNETVAIIYRHSDGDPDVAGVDIIKFLQILRDGKFDSGSRLTSPAHLAARYVVFLAQKFAVHYNSGETIPNKNKLDFISVMVVMSDPGDIEFRYVVDCDSLTDDGIPEVRG